MEPKHYLILTIFWVVTVTVLSLVSINISSPQVFESSDKFAHIFLYSILTFLTLKSMKKIKFKVISIIILSIFVYGIIIEVLQKLLTQKRSADFYDVVANSFGILIGFLVFSFLTKMKFNIQTFKSKK